MKTTLNHWIRHLRELFRSAVFILLSNVLVGASVSNIELQPSSILGRGTLESVAYSKINNRLAIGGSTGIDLYSLTDGAFIKRFSTESVGRIQSVLFSQNGRWIIAGTRSWELILVDLNEAESINLLDLSNDSVFNVRNQSNGFKPNYVDFGILGMVSVPETNLVVITEASGALWTLDLDSQTIVARSRIASWTNPLISKQGWLSGETRDPEGNRITFLLDAHTLLQPEVNFELDVLRSMTALTFSPDGNILLGRSDNQLKLLNLKTGDLESIRFSNGFQSAVYSGDGKQILVAAVEKSIVLDAQNGETIDRLTSRVNHRTKPIYSEEDQSFYFLRDIDLKMVQYQPEGKEIVNRGPELFQSQGLDGYFNLYSPASNSVILGTQANGLMMWNHKSGLIQWRIDHYSMPIETALLLNENEILTVGSQIFGGGIGKTWDLESQDISNLTDLNSAYAIDSSSGGEELYTPGFNWGNPGGDYAINVINRTSGEVEDSFGYHQNQIWSIAVSRDDTKLISGSDDKTARVWDLANGNLLAEMKHRNLVRTVAFAPNSELVASGDERSRTKVWNATTGELLHEFGSNGVTELAFGPSSDKLAIGDFQSELTIRDLTDGRTIKRIKLSSWIKALFFSPDGKWIFIGGDHNGLVQAKEIDGRREFSFIGHRGTVNDGGFLPDGEQIYTVSNDGQLIIWNLADIPAVMQYAFIPEDHSMDIWWEHDFIKGKQSIQSVGDISIPWTMLDSVNKGQRIRIDLRRSQNEFFQIHSRVP